MEEQEEEELDYVVSYQIKFHDDVRRFLRDYKKVHGSTVQWFVETAVYDKIRDIMIKQELGEL